MLLTPRVLVKSAISAAEITISVGEITIFHGCWIAKGLSCPCCCPAPRPFCCHVPGDFHRSHPAGCTSADSKTMWIYPLVNYPSY